MCGNPGGLAAILSKPVWRRWFATCEPPKPYRSRFSTEFAGIACISVTKDEARSTNEESARPCGEATQKLVNWVCPGTASGAFCISGRSSPAHPPASDSGAQSFTHNAWRAATFNTGSTREPISHRTRFRIGLGSLRQNSRANNPQSSK